MTADGVPGITSDEGLVNFANCALKMLREAPRIQKASEVSDDFLTEIAVILFGSDLVPFLNPPNTSSREANVAAILNKLSQEIDLQLDHIDPADVVLGARKDVSNMLELLTAFILYCLDEGLLDFDRISFSQPESSTIDYNKLEPSNCHTHLSMSPEIPRASLNHLCPYANTPKQNSMQSGQPTQSSKFPLKVLTESSASTSTTSGNKDHFPHSNKNCTSNVEFHGTSTTADSPLNYPERSSSVGGTRLMPMQRLHRFPPLPSDDSPPATPKGADELVEIIKHQSPLTVPPSLRCSPVLIEGQYPTANNAGTWENIPFPVNKSPNIEKLEASLSTGKELHQFTSASDQSSVISDSESEPGDCVSNRKQTVIPQRRLRRKVSSSSSGRGHSATQTLTAPGNSVTSMPPSLSESPLPVPPATDLLRTQTGVIPPRDVACQTTEHLLTSTRHRLKNTCSSQRTRRAHIDFYGSQNSAATTNSILGWSTDHQSRYKSEHAKCQSDSTTSVLSSSFYSKLSDRDHVGPSPSASVLLARTEGFSRALKRRLDYLRMIFCRAHNEAQAVSQLVQLIGSQNAETLEFMDRCLRTDRKSIYTDPRTPYSSKPLERMVQRILVGIEVLLNRQSPPITTKTVHRNSSSTRRSTEPSGKCVSNLGSSNEKGDKSRDLQFEELMNMKHSLMVNSLTWLQSQLKSKVPSATKVVRAAKTSCGHRLRSPSTMRL